MTTFPHYQRDIRDNPVQRAEQSHFTPKKVWWFWRASYALTLFLTVAPILWGVGVHFYKTLGLSAGFLILLNIPLIFIIEMRIISQASESMRREFDGKTWDLLIMTGVDTWRLVIGKWLGVIKSNRRDIAFLYFLRVSTFFWALTTHFLREDGFRQWSYWSREDYVPAFIWDIRTDIQLIIGAMVIMGVFLILEMLLVASLPLGLSLIKKTRKYAVWSALGLRGVVPYLLNMALLLVFYLIPRILWFPDGDMSYSREVVAGFTGFILSLFDNGLSWIVANAGTISLFAETTNMTLFYLAQIMGIGFYILWIWIMLRFAKYQAGRYNVSAPGFIPKSKPKRHIKADARALVDKPVYSTSPKPTRSPRESNLLGIQNPALYRCEVIAYDCDSSELKIAVYRMTSTLPEFHVHFSGVSFFRGEMSWTNAKFETLSEMYLRHFAENQKLDFDKLPNGSCLYVVQSQGNRVRIIATGVRVEELVRELE